VEKAIAQAAESARGQPRQRAGGAARVSDGVHVYLRDRILSGELVPGAAVPSERELSERLGVNRHAVREAINRLQQARLVEVNQGGPTRVLDWRITGGLELIVDLVRDPGQELAVALVRSVVELRASIGVDAARRCAERAPLPIRERAAELAERAAVTHELTARAEANTALWIHLVDGAENLAYRLALNSLLEGVAEHPELDTLLNRPDEDAEYYRWLARALRDADASAASAAARTLLEAPLRCLSR
jgi:GntR family transcriptional repressor for pyruvate dehydrogenase complex